MCSLLLEAIPGPPGGESARFVASDQAPFAYPHQSTSASRRGRHFRSPQKGTSSRCLGFSLWQVHPVQQGLEAGVGADRVHLRIHGEENCLDVMHIDNPV
jgi:hypothetical protein